MNHIVTTEIESSPTTAEAYNARRAAMADETRTRILEACVTILGRGVTELSIPAVAREAGVSVPTVYRNFPDKKTLVQETALYLKKMRGPNLVPAQLDDVPAHLQMAFTRAASAGETVRAALVSEPILEARRELGEQAERMAQCEQLLGDALDAFSGSDREHALRMITVLCSSTMLRNFREIVGATPETAAETVAWTVSQLLGRPWKSVTESSPQTTSSKTKAQKRKKKGTR